MQWFDQENRHQPKANVHLCFQTIGQGHIQSQAPQTGRKGKESGQKAKDHCRQAYTGTGKGIAPNELARHQKELDLYGQTINQKRTDKNKIYSIHTPFTGCIAKGKAHRQYEFGNKVGLLATSKTLIVTAIKAFEGNPHDSKTIGPLLEQTKCNKLTVPEEVVYDRGGKGQKQIGDTIISTPYNKPLKRDTDYQRKKKRKKFRRRAAIEPVIGHLKTDSGMGQNHLHGAASPQINAFLAAAGWNLKKMMLKLKQEAISWLQFLLRLLNPIDYLLAC